MAKANDQSERGLGYKFLKPLPTAFESYEELKIEIRETPTKQHFDPELVEILVRSDKSRVIGLGVEKTRLHSPWPGKERYQLIIDRIYIRDRIGKTVEAFCFGGELVVRQGSGMLDIQVSSTAPIIDLEEPDPLTQLLVAEVEAILAETRAKLVKKDKELEKMLIQFQPLTLYAACLLSLEQKINSFSHKELLEYQQLLLAVKKEMGRIKSEQMWPSKVDNLAALLLK